MIFYDLREYSGSLFWKGSPGGGILWTISGGYKKLPEKSVSKTKLNFEELHSVIVKTEKCVYLRRLTYFSEEHKER